MKNVVRTSDRVEVVRCGECRHRMKEDGEFPDDVCPLQDFYGDLNHVRRVPENWFCADGERRDEAYDRD